MVARFTLCDANKLEMAVAGELPEAALGELSRHLQSCPHCRSELDVLAGGEKWLGEARQYLSSSDELVAVQETTPPAGVASLHSLQHDAPKSGFVPFPKGDDEPAIDLDFLSPSDDPEKLGRLGSYEIESVIGRGGFGVVLKALDPNLNRYVAIKALSGTLIRSSAARKRFHHEAKAAAAVVHDHVIPIHHIETSGAAPYLVMPFITGRSLQERIDEHGPIETKEVLRIAMQAAQGLAAAHAQGLVHRDIKPANILLENGVERVRITDFGLARAVDDASQTQSGYIAGTPQYMAPEQARGESVDARADLFSLGSVMYAMCTGHPPFRAETTLAVLRRICDDQPRSVRENNPEVPAWLAAIIEKLLAKSPAARFQTADEVAELLGKWLAHVQQPTVIPPPAIVVAKSARKNDGGTFPVRIFAGSALALAAGMLLVAGLYAWLPGLLIQEVPQNAQANSAANSKASKTGQFARTSPPALRIPSPAPLDTAAARSDRAVAEAIAVELYRTWQEVTVLESALIPADASGRSIATELEELRSTLDRLERELGVSKVDARAQSTEIPSPESRTPNHEP